MRGMRVAFPRHAKLLDIKLITTFFGRSRWAVLYGSAEMLDPRRKHRAYHARNTHATCDVADDKGHIDGEEHTCQAPK